MLTKLANIRFLCFDIDGVYYDHNSVPNLSFKLPEIRAQTACNILGTLISYDEAYKIAAEGYTHNGDSVTALGNWVEKQGMDADAFKDSFFCQFHRAARLILLEAAPHVFAHKPDMAESFRQLNGAVSHGVATHGHVEEWAAPILHGSGVINHFERHAMFGLNQAGYNLKHVNAIMVQQCIAAMNGTMEQSAFIEDTPRNLACAKEEEPSLTTILIHHGRPLEQQPHHIDFQFATVIELNRAMLVARQDGRKLIFA